MESKGRVQSIDRAVAILKCFSEKKRELKLSEIADKLDLNKSTVHGIITTLKYHGLIDQDDETQKYRLGLFLIELGDIVTNSLDVRAIATPIIEDVCNKLEETVHIGSLDDMEVIYIDKKESNQSMRIFTTIGARNPAHCTGLGKIMLAYMNEDYVAKRLQEELKQLTPNTITDKTKLIRELAKIKENGYAIDNEENNIGLICIAAPIFDFSGKVKYGISVSGPTIRMTDDKIRETMRVIKNAAKEVSYKLGYKEQ
ncbi:IclR family transcriptional regulator [Tissierella sp. Yu-01]|uniref:IclR family transcriptional regulator n=1 Tax=Tissierella sp. Yu-01 TaxID=3035694 RepID=UPI00240D91F3|nr:IclR family transcriptional regulator [Tissierella sp. Yu-01]WFA08651.1 IclR family transcriptional regulator [Tissierella sp. Yu-01]